MIRADNINLIIGDWGLGMGDWGLGIGDWAQSPIPNPQSPIPIIEIFFIIIIIKNITNNISIINIILIF